MRQQDPAQQVVRGYERLDLQTVKAALMEQSEREGRIQPLGELSGDTTAEVWTGGVSLRERTDSGELSRQDVERYTGMLSQYFVPVTPGAPVRCVEDRTLAEYDTDDPGSFGQPLGPQRPGATADEAYTDRLLAVSEALKGRKEIPGDVSLADDVQSLAGRSGEFTPGAHSDDHHGPECTGCGSVDTMAKKNGRIANDPRVLDVAANKTEAIFSLDDKEPPEDFAKDLKVSAAELQERVPRYFDSIVQAMKNIRQANATGVPSVTGAHKAISVTLNFVRNTTFHTSEYNTATGNQANNFNLDVWEIIDSFPPKKAAFIIAQAINTLAGLTDGSQQVFARLPK